MSGPTYSFPRVHSWLSLLAAGPFALTAIVGLEYQGAAPFAVLAVLCVIHAAVPTRAIWYFVVAVNAGAAAFMLCLVVRDIFGLATGGELRVLAGDDWLYVLPFTAFLVALTYGLYRTRARLAAEMGASSSA